MTAGKPASRAETELRSVLDAAGMGTFDLDMTTRLVVVDRRTRRAFGIGSDRPVIPVDELLAVIHPDDVPKVQQHITSAAETLGDYSVEHRVCLPDEERWLDIHGQAVQGVDDHLHVIGTIRDSTDLRSARDEVARVLEHLGEAVVSLDGDNRVTYLNSRAEQLLGRDRTSLVGSAGSDLRALLGNRFTQPVPPSGEPVRVEDWSEPLGIWLEMRLDPQPVGSSIYLADVTERRSVHERTRRLQRIAAALASAVTSADVAEVMLEHVSRGVDADAAGMFLVDPERHELRLDAGLHEIDDKLRRRWTRLPLAASTPLNEAISSGRPQLVSEADVVSRFPHLARDVAELHARASTRSFPWPPRAGRWACSPWDGRAAPASRRTSSPSSSPSRRRVRRPWSGRSSTTSSAGSPRASSAACCRRSCRRWTTSIWAPATSPARPAYRWVATGTT